METHPTEGQLARQPRGQYELSHVTGADSFSSTFQGCTDGRHHFSATVGFTKANATNVYALDEVVGTGRSI
jgi:hypothetical protein